MKRVVYFFSKLRINAISFSNPAYPLPLLPFSILFTNQDLLATSSAIESWSDFFSSPLYYALFLSFFFSTNHSKFISKGFFKIQDTKVSFNFTFSDLVCVLLFRTTFQPKFNLASHVCRLLAFEKDDNFIFFLSIKIYIYMCMSNL